MLRGKLRKIDPMSTKPNNQLEATMENVLEMISGFETGDFSKTLSATQDQKLKPLADKLNSAAKILAAQAAQAAQTAQAAQDTTFIIDSLGIGIWKWDLVTNNLEWDENMYKLYGCAPNEFNGALDAWENSLSAETKARAVEEISAAVTGGKNFDTTFQVIQRNTGRIQEIRTRAFVIRDDSGTPLKMWGINLDRSREAELELTQNRTKDMLEEAQSTAKIGSWTFDLASSYLIWSPEHYRIFEVEEPKSQEKLFQLYRDRIHPDELSTLDHLTKRALEFGEGYVFNHRVYLDKGTRIKYVRGIAKVTKDECGRAIKLSGTCQDITEEKLKDIEREKSKKFLASILDHIPGPIYSKGLDGKYILVNNKYLEAVPVPKGNITNMTDKDIFPKEIYEPLILNDQRIATEKREQTYRETVPHPDGTTRTYETRKFPILGECGEVLAVTGISFDITNQILAEKKYEAERLKSIRNAKLASLGEMSAGIAHEINNPLTIISGSVGLLSKFADNPEKMASKVEAIKRSCDRISRIVQGLKKFSRSGEKSDIKNHMLCNIIKEAIIITETKSKRHSVPVTIDCKSHSMVACDDVEIEQVLVNLINNAIDAIKERSEKWVKFALFDDATAVVLRATDSGLGIPEDVRNKLFEPFFTTKNVGEGTGLGLSIAKGILDEHKATISVVTDSPNTCFEIRFPRANEINNAT